MKKVKSKKETSQPPVVQPPTLEKNNSSPAQLNMFGMEQKNNSTGGGPSTGSNAGEQPDSLMNNVLPGVAVTKVPLGSLDVIAEDDEDIHNQSHNMSGIGGSAAKDSSEVKMSNTREATGMFGGARLDSMNSDAPAT